MVSDRQRDLLLSIGVPLASFGGIALAFALASAGLIEEPGRFGWGCVVGSVLLAVLAFLKPRKDIVSLTTPLYALILFVVPSELEPNILMQLLFAASLTVLVYRLNRSFSKKRGDARTAVPKSD
ncbi:MAG: hypothetical protein GXY82_09285 [Methanospirillum sp.]|nr:hypothetical protein [Methanospirillum sp.]